MCPDLGIGETLAALFATEAAAAPAELGAGAAALGATAGDALPFLTAGAAETAAATTLPEILVTPAAAGFGGAELAAGAGALGGAAALFGGGPSLPEAPLGTSGAIQPNSVPAFNIGAAGPTPEQLGTTAAGNPPGPGASAFAAPQGVTSPLGPDPTAASRANFLETSNPLENVQRADFGIGQAPGNDFSPTPVTTSTTGPFTPGTAPANAPAGFSPNAPVDTPGGALRTDIATAPNADLTQPQFNPTPGAQQPATQPVVSQGNPGGTAAPASSTGTGGVTAAPPGSQPGFLDKLVSGAQTSLTKNPLGIGLGAAGLGYAIMTGQQMSAAQKKMQDQAAGLNAQGQQLMSYLTSGTLPPGLKSSLDQATAAAKQKIIANYAAQGMNADPNKNSALAQQLQLVDQQAIISTAQIGQQLATTGVAESGLASSLYTSLANLDATQTANVGKAIASMAAAFNTGGGIKLNIGGASA